MAAPRLTFPPPASGRVDVLVVAGEHSGDQNAARMVAGLRARLPGVQVCALGGPRLAAAGAQLLHDLTASSVVGFAGVLRHLGFFRALQAETIRWIGAYAPRAVCFVDYSGFNLRLAAALRERGLSAKGGGRVRLLYYISPQIWASRRGRRFGMARDLDALAVIFPFEAAGYADTSLPVEYVGHPFSAPDYAPPVRYDPAGPVLLLPGSRQQAVARIFPALLAAQRADGERPAVAIYPSEEIAGALRRALGGAADGTGEPSPEVRLEPAGSPVAAAAVLTSSGTMSLHCALGGIPGAIAYRIDPLTYLLGRWLVKVPYLGIANLLLNEPMYPEYIQGAATPGALAAELKACLHDPARQARTAEQAARLRALLAQPAAGTAGDWLAQQLGGHVSG
jgi:lipid-A-disaccharide synthase